MKEMNVLGLLFYIGFLSEDWKGISHAEHVQGSRERATDKEPSTSMGRTRQADGKCSRELFAQMS